MESGNVLKHFWLTKLLEKFSVLTFNKLKVQQEFAWKHSRIPKSVLYEQFFIIFDINNNPNPIFALNLENLQWSQVKITGEAFLFDCTASFCFYSRDIIIAYGGEFTFDAQVNQYKPVLSFLTIKKTEEG